MTDREECGKKALMPIDNAANWFVRLMAMAFVMSFASGVALLGYWMLMAIVRDPAHVEPFRATLLVACLATVGLLLYTIHRLATWTSTRADGNLVPPGVYYAVLAPFCVLWAVFAVRGMLAGDWRQALSLGLAVLTGLGLMAEVRRRARNKAAKPRASVISR
jgi:hypothetical protein